MDLKIKQESGFTLIEVIASLLLVSIMAVVAGVGIAWFAQGYVLANEATHTAQKAQLAMSRLSRELKELSSITAIPDTEKISFVNTFGDRKIARDGDTIKIAGSGETYAEGDILIDKVNSFELTYYRDYQAGQTWVLGTHALDDLTAIRIEFKISGIGPRGISVTFDTIIYPRNT